MLLTQLQWNLLPLGTNSTNIFSLTIFSYSLFLKEIPFLIINSGTSNKGPSEAGLRMVLFLFSIAGSMYAVCMYAVCTTCRLDDSMT